MTTRDREDTRAAWDGIARGYDRTNTPTQMWLGNEVSAVPGSVPECGSWTSRPGAGP